MRSLLHSFSLMLILCLLLPCCALSEESASTSPAAEVTPTATPTEAITPVSTDIPQSLFAPFNLTLPETAYAEVTDSRVTLVQDASRVVVIYLSRVPDDDPEAALPVLMQNFDNATDETIPFAAEEGFWILGGVVPSAFGEGEDKITLMVLAANGDLLILSGYNQAQSHQALYDFLTSLLERVTFNGNPVYLPESAEETR